MLNTKRSTGKYLLASGVTALYLGTVYQAFKEPQAPKPAPEKVAIGAGIMIGLTWIAAAL